MPSRPVEFILSTCSNTYNQSILRHSIPPLLEPYLDFRTQAGSSLQHTPKFKNKKSKPKLLSSSPPEVFRSSISPQMSQPQKNAEHHSSQRLSIPIHSCVLLEHTRFRTSTQWHPVKKKPTLTDPLHLRLSSPCPVRPTYPLVAATQVGPQNGG